MTESRPSSFTTIAAGVLCAVLCAAPLLILGAIAGVIAPIVPAIAGIVVGAGALALLVVWLVRRRRQ